MIDELLAYNKEFVKNRGYKDFITTKFPNKKIAILSCMDTRLTELLPAAFGFKNGDVKIIKNAGAQISSPFGSVARSLVIAIYTLEVDEILVIGHDDCGMSNLKYDDLLAKMKEKDISEETFKIIESCGIDLEKWLTGFDNVDDSVQFTVKEIINHPLIPNSVHVHGLIMDPNTGKVRLV